MIVYYSKLLYALKKHDQLADLIKDNELKELFNITPCTHILMLALIDEQRHLQACEIFLEYLIYLDQSKINEVIIHEEIRSMTDLIELFAKSVYLLVI